MYYYWNQQHENAKLYNEKKTKEDDKILDKMLKLEPDEFVAQSKKNEYISEKLTIEMQKNACSVFEKIDNPEDEIIRQMIRKMDSKIKFRPNLAYFVDCLLNIKDIKNWAFVTNLTDIKNYQVFLHDGGDLTFTKFIEYWPDGNYDFDSSEEEEESE